MDIIDFVGHPYLSNKRKRYFIKPTTQEKPSFHSTIFQASSRITNHDTFPPSAIVIRSPPLCLNTPYIPPCPSIPLFFPLFSAYFTRDSYVLHMFHRYQERATRLFVRISTFLPYSTGRRTTNGTSRDYISSPRIRTIVRHAFAFANITRLKTRFFPIICTYFSINSLGIFF